MEENTEHSYYDINSKYFNYTRQGSDDGNNTKETIMNVIKQQLNGSENNTTNNLESE